MQYPDKLFKQWQEDNRANAHVAPLEDNVSESPTVLDYEFEPRSVCLLNSDDLIKAPDQLNASTRKALYLFNDLFKAFRQVLKQPESNEEVQEPGNEEAMNELFGSRVISAIQEQQKIKQVIFDDQSDVSTELEATDQTSFILSSDAFQELVGVISDMREKIIEEAKENIIQEAQSARREEALAEKPELSTVLDQARHCFSLCCRI